MKSFEELKSDFYNNSISTGLFASINENDEAVIVEVTNEYLKTSTMQNNGWIRINIYHKDHTVEEFVEK